MIKTADAGKNLKYAGKAGMNRTIAKLRDDFWTMLLEHDPDVRHALFDSLYHEIALYPESIRPCRSPERKIPRNKRFPIARAIGKKGFSNQRSKTSLHSQKE